MFCEKPVALDIAGTREIVDGRQNPAHHCRSGCSAASTAATSQPEMPRNAATWAGCTPCAVTADAQPPPASSIPTSGGLFRDCGLHDFDAIRWITGREVRSVRSSGSNRGAEFFRENGDVDTAALLELGDGTLAATTASRYNGAGYDVRLEVCGSRGGLFVGNDDRAPLPSAEREVS